MEPSQSFKDGHQEVLLIVFSRNPFYLKNKGIIKFPLEISTNGEVTSYNSESLILILENTLTEIS